MPNAKEAKQSELNEQRKSFARVFRCASFDRDCWLCGQAVTLLHISTADVVQCVECGCKCGDESKD